MSVEPNLLFKKAVASFLTGRRNRRFFMLSVALLLAGAASTAFFWIDSASARGFDFKGATPPGISVPTSPPQSEKVMTILRSGGFEPAAVTRTGGQYTLVVANRSGANELRFLLKRATGEQVRDMTVPPNSLEWSEAIDIPAGNYYLIEASHPSWVFHITIH